MSETCEEEACSDGVSAAPVSPDANANAARQWFAMVPATVIRDRRLTSSTRDVLTALLLYADTSGACHPSQGRIADDLGISREEVNRRLRKLKVLGYVTSDAPTSKGGTSTYQLHLTPRCDETVTPCAQPVTKRSQGCDETITPPVTKRSHRTYPSNKPIEHIQTDANASGAAVASASPPSSSSAVKAPSERQKKSRKLTDDQLEAHGLEQQWCREVLAELARRLDVKTVPRAGQQKEAAKWFYRELSGVDESQKRLWQCYDLTKRSPFWRDKTLLLSDLLRPFPEYRRDPAGYRAAIERECQEGKSNGKLSGNRRNSAGRDRSASEPRKFTDEWYDWREREHQRLRGVGSSSTTGSV